MLALFQSLGNYKFLGVLVGVFILVLKNWIEHSDSNGLEKILNSRLTSFYNDLFLLFISFFILLVVFILAPTKEETSIFSNKITFIIFLFLDFILCIIGLIIAKLAVYFIDTKYDYYVLFKGSNSDNKEVLEWKLIKNSGKRGYLIKNEQGIIDFIKNISEVKFQEVKRKRRKWIFKKTTRKI
ncbi:hypothetical protein [Rummeliibacillus stabekisii]|uniref:hypothetical protein n=1 Tax=Rummeliibacillus stabekisii TaxID=241244 RepID=UPI00371884E1